jgi:hypothetical protein
MAAGQKILPLNLRLCRYAVKAASFLSTPMDQCFVWFVAKVGEGRRSGSWTAILLNQVDFVEIL